MVDLKGSRFLGLPGEIRNSIYKLVLATDQERISLQGVRYVPMNRHVRAHMYHHVPGLLLCCKQIRREAKGFDSMALECAGWGMRKHLRNLGTQPQKCQNIQTVSIRENYEFSWMPLIENWPTYYYWPFPFGAFQGLRSFTMWGPGQGQHEFKADRVTGPVHLVNLCKSYHPGDVAFTLSRAQRREVLDLLAVYMFSLFPPWLYNAFLEPGRKFQINIRICIHFRRRYMFLNGPGNGMQYNPDQPLKIKCMYNMDTGRISEGTVQYLHQFIDWQ